MASEERRLADRPPALLVDTHAHLCDEVFDDDRAAVLERARAAGVGAIIAVGEDLDDATRTLELATEFAMLRPAAGLYPTILDEERARAMHELIRRERERLVAIGEVGLDFWAVKEEADRELQRRLFHGFVDLSRELDLPLNIHSRAAGRHVVAILLEAGARRVQMHAFDGRAVTARPAVEAGYCFSVPPSIVHSRQKQKLVRQLPLECLLLETDSPVLGPEPNERNEPANVTASLQAIAELKGLPVAEVTAAIAENTRRLYGDLLP